MCAAEPGLGLPLVSLQAASFPLQAFLHRQGKRGSIHSQPLHVLAIKPQPPAERLQRGALPSIKRLPTPPAAASATMRLEAELHMRALAGKRDLAAQAAVGTGSRPEHPLVDGALGPADRP